MKKEFEELSFEEIKALRKKKLSIPDGKMFVRYTLTEDDIQRARKHLKNFYEGRVNYPFAADMRLKYILDD